MTMFLKMGKWLKISMAAALILAGMTGCSRGTEESPVVARVGSAELRVADIKQRLGSEVDGSLDRQWQNYIYRWVDDELLYQSALAEDFDKLPEIKFETEKLRRELIIGHYVDSKISAEPQVTEEEAAAYYEEHKDSFVRNHGEFRYFFLICRDKEGAQQIKEALRGGKGFEEIVRSAFPDSVINRRWDSGYVRIEQVIQPLQKNISSQRQGRIYGPVATADGHVVYQLVEKHEKDTVRELALVRDQIMQQMREERYRIAYQNLIASLRNQKKVDLFLSAAK